VASRQAGRRKRKAEKVDTSLNLYLPRELGVEWQRIIKRLELGGKANWKALSAAILLAAETPSDTLRFYAGAVASCRENEIPLSLLAQLARSGVLRDLAEKESAKLAPNFGEAYKVIIEPAKALPRGRELAEVRNNKLGQPKKKG